MNRRTALATLPALASPLALGAASASPAAGPQLAHMVFFTLKDRTAEGREKLVGLCHKYLSGHEHVAYYSVGTIAEDVVEPGVSVRDFDVALHLVFDDKTAKETYLKSPRHDAFVASLKDFVSQARVFDSYITGK
jgi:hypothetical protein